MTIASKLERAAQRRISGFEKKYGQSHLHLAYHAALPVALNTDLIHFLRINFFFDGRERLPYTAEADLLLSPLCTEIGDDLYEMDPEVRDILLRGLVERYKRERLEEVAALLWQYIQRYTPWSDRVKLERAQQLTALSYLDPARATHWLVEEASAALSIEQREWFVAMSKEVVLAEQILPPPIEEIDEQIVGVENVNAAELEALTIMSELESPISISSTGEESGTLWGTYIIHVYKVARYARDAFKEQPIWPDQCRSIIEGFRKRPAAEETARETPVSIRPAFYYIEDQVVKLILMVEEYERTSQPSSRRLENSRKEILHRLSELIEELETLDNEALKGLLKQAQESVTSESIMPAPTSLEHLAPSSAQPAAPRASFVHGYALIIGIARYADPGITDLSLLIVKDAVDMHTVLRDPELCGYHDEHIRVLTDTQAAGANIRDGLQWLARMAQTDEEATILFYFSGHSERIEIDGQISYYLYPYNCNLDELQSTALSGQELSQLLFAIRAPRLLVILDTCYSEGIDVIKGPGRGGVIFKGGLQEADYQGLAQGQGRVILASSRPTETSRSSSALNNSLFTRYLIEALRGKAHSHGDGLLRVYDVYNYASAEVSKQRSQHPVMTSYISENFSIALYRGGKRTALSTHQAQTVSTDAVDQSDLREAIVRAFSLEELRMLSADITDALRRDGIDELIYLDLLQGDSLRGKAQSLVEFFTQRELLSYLIGAVCRARPRLELCKSQEQASRTSSEQQPPESGSTASKKKGSSPGDERDKFKKGGNPCGALNRYRQVVATIEQTLDTTPGQEFTIIILQSYVDSLIAVITSLRKASDSEVRRCLRSRQSVLESLREARNELQLALQPLIEKGERGKNRQYYTALTRARKRLAEALTDW